MAEKPLDVLSAKNLISQEIKEVYRKEVEEEARGKIWQTIR